MWQNVASQKKKIKWASLDLSKGFYCLVVVFQDASNYLALCLCVTFTSVLPQKILIPAFTELLATVDGAYVSMKIIDISQGNWFKWS